MNYDWSLSMFTTSWLKHSLGSYDFTSLESLKSYLQNDMQIKNYDTSFSLFQDNQPIDLSQARLLILNAIISDPRFEQEYYPIVLKLVDMNERPDRSSVHVDLDKDNDILIFEHDDIIRFPVHLGNQTKVRSLSRRSGHSSTQRKFDLDKKQKEQKLQEKLQEIQSVDVMDYVTHANQCGYLTKHTRFDVLHTANMWASSVQTLVAGITIDRLQSFIDATGQPVLSKIESHLNSSEGIQNTQNGVEGWWKGFAIAIIDFINLEFIIDIDVLCDEYKNQIGHSGYRTIEEWGGTKEVVLKRLIERKPKNVSASDIEEYFMEGYGGTLT